MRVYVLLHARCADDSDEAEDIKIIGVYSSRENAIAAVQRLSAQPGFSDSIEGLSVDEYDIDKDHWRSGFVRV